MNHKLTLNPRKQEMAANAQSFDAKLANLVSGVKELIFVDLEAYPAHDDIIQSELKKVVFSLAGRQINLCLGCGVDMGECNPRQYCRKTFCPTNTNTNTVSYHNK